MPQKVKQPTCYSDSQRDIDGGEQPQHNDGEQAAHGEDDEGAAAVDDGADEEQQTEQGAHPEEAHGHRPPDSLDPVHTEMVIRWSYSFF